MKNVGTQKIITVLFFCNYTMTPYGLAVYSMSLQTCTGNSPEKFQCFLKFCKNCPKKNTFRFTHVHNLMYFFQIIKNRRISVFSYSNYKYFSNFLFEKFSVIFPGMSFLARRLKFDILQIVNYKI